MRKITSGIYRCHLGLSRKHYLLKSPADCCGEVLRRIRSDDRLASETASPSVQPERKTASPQNILLCSSVVEHKAILMRYLTRFLQSTKTLPLMCCISSSFYPPGLRGWEFCTIFRPFFQLQKFPQSSVISVTNSPENCFLPKPKKRLKIAKPTKHETLPKRDANFLKFP